MKKSSGAGSQGNFFFFFCNFPQEEIISKAHWYLASYLPLASLSLANTKRGWRNSLIAGCGGHGRSLVVRSLA